MRLVRSILSQRVLPLLLVGVAHQPLHAADDPFQGIAAVEEGTMIATDQALQLELVVNGVSSGLIVSVRLANGRFELLASDLTAAGVTMPTALGGGLVALGTIEGVSVDYDQPNQRLKIMVPMSWLPRQSIGGAKLARQSSIGGTGLLLNYDLNFTDGPDRRPAAAAWGEVRFFSPFGRFSQTVGTQDGQFIRYDTSWIHSDEERMITYEAGDLVTRNLPGNRPVRMAGFQVSRDFSVRPDVITYPLPEFAGEARLPSAVDLFIDGYRAGGSDVAPGRFSIDALPGLNGAGQATVAVTDIVGRRIATTIPFYVTNELLRAGLLDFSVAAGVLRQRYARRNFDYGAAAATGAARYGVSRFLTVEGSIEASKAHAMGSIGALVQLGTLGVVNFGYALSRGEGRTAGRISAGYQYRARQFGLAVNHVREGRGFTDLASIDDRRAARSITTVAASLSTNRVGNFGASYISTRDRRGERVDLATGSWSLPLLNGATLLASANYELRDRQWSGALNLILPLGDGRSSAAASLAHETRGATTIRADYSRSVPIHGGIGGSATIARASDTGWYGAGEVVWRTSVTELRAGAFGRRGDVTRWGGISGSVVAMDGGVFAANRIADSFVLINAGGREGVPVRYENQIVGMSDANGHFLVPWVASYYPARYSIDPFELPADVILSGVEQRVAVRRGSGAVVNFDLKTARSARVILLDQAGKPIPVGAVASVNGGPPLAIGWDGLVFIEAVEDHNRLTVALPDGGGCAAEFEMPRGESAAGTVGPIACR